VSAEHYGDPLIEMRAFARGTATVDVSDHDIVRVSGPDRLVWLNSLITQQVLDLPPGVTAESLILSPQGHVEHAFFVTDDGETTWLLVGPGRGQPLVTWLSSMVFRMHVTVHDDPGQWTILATRDSLRDRADPPVIEFTDPWPHVGEGSLGYAPDPHPGEDWSVHYSVFGAQREPVIEGMTQAGTLALTGMRIAAGRPSMDDVDNKTLPHELDWLRTAVHLNKGCYRGQETVAKVHNLGHPPRRLTLLHLDGSESIVPIAGDEVLLGEKPVGVITSAAWHFEEGPLGLALLKRSTPVDDELMVSTGPSLIPAAQVVLVPPDAGATRAVPRLPRLGKRGE
jgi:tRNA-modifying protein YgfZ